VDSVHGTVDLFHKFSNTKLIQGNARRLEFLQKHP
jgi:hypothetical protein